MKDRRINICLFTDSLEPSGVGKHMSLLAEGFDQERFNVHLVCPLTQGGFELARRVTQFGVHYHPLTVRSEYGWIMYNDLVDLLRSRDIDIFHSHAGATWESHLGILAASEAGVPVIMNTEHLPFILEDEGEIAIKREINTLLDALITVSHEARATHTASGTIPADKAVVVYNGIDPTPYLNSRRMTKRAQMVIDNSTPLIVTVARLYEQKGHRYLIKAMQRVLQQIPGAGLLLVGEGPLYWELRQQANDLGIGDRVWLEGKRNDVPEILGAADVVVLPSLFEGLPLVVLEAMAAGIPVVGTRVCGTEELIIDNVTGLLVPSADSGALAKAIVHVLENPTHAHEMGLRGRERMLGNFTARHMSENTTAIYTQLLARANSHKVKVARPVRTQQDRQPASPVHAVAPVR